MKFVGLLAFLGLTASLSLPYDAIPNFATKLKGEALRDYVNGVQSLWRAEMPTTDRSKALMAIKHTKLPSNAPVAEVVIADDIPESFDARTAWPQCPSIGQIRDQSDCGSCWAFGAAEAMSDRTCITKGINVTLSADDLLSCCGTQCGYGCEGGYPINAWQWWVQQGVVTGGGFYENSFCKPYPIQPCGKTIDDNGEPHYHYCRGGEVQTPECHDSCSNTDYPIPYKQDKHFGKSAYAVPQNIDAIKTEIMKNGPVECAFTVYDDFYYYTTGIYKHVSGGVDGGHAVKILGWGVENGTPYWLVANSWNTSWGEKGFFRIVLGTNECGIEEAIVAGLAQ